MSPLLGQSVGLSGKNIKILKVYTQEPVSFIIFYMYFICIYLQIYLYIFYTDTDKDTLR